MKETHCITKIDRALFERFYHQYPEMLQKEISGNCKSLLDVGCGSDSPALPLARELESYVGIDSFIPYLEKNQEKESPVEYKIMDVLEIGNRFPAKSCDCVLASDVIEHLTKENGLKLMQMMEKIARKKVILFTPNGFVPQSAYDGNKNQVHVSGWEVDEMRNFGYRVIGINGWKPLRGERGNITWRPHFLWRRISYASQSWVVNRPKLAFQILCIKDMT